MATRSNLIPPPRQVNLLAAQIEQLIHLALNRNNAGASVISTHRLRDVSYYFLRDMYKISDHQDDEISGTKYAAYLAFWIRKLKPIAIAYDTAHEDFADRRENAEIKEINESIALEIALALLIDSGRGTEPGTLHEMVRQRCVKTCDGRSCLKRYAMDYFSFNDRYYEKYIKYSMQYRTFAPYHLTAIFDQMIFAACRCTS